MSVLCQESYCDQHAILKFLLKTKQPDEENLDDEFCDCTGTMEKVDSDHDTKVDSDFSKNGRAVMN